MNQINFFCFQSILYKSQPSHSNWCWAACLSNMINGLNANSKIGSSQCNLASFYSEFGNNQNTTLQVYSNCCPTKLNEPNCNLGLSERDLIEIHNLSGFTAVETKNIDDFQFIKDSLIKFQSPIILKIMNQGGGSHVNLITGYGEVDECKYVLISDPINSIGESYIEFNNFKATFNIDKAWVTEVKSDNLIEDKQLLRAISYIKNFINKADIWIYRHVNKPLNYLGHIDPLFVSEGINKTLSEEYTTVQTNEFIGKLDRYFKSQLTNTCQKEVNRGDTINGEINFINENRLSYPDRTLINSINKRGAFTYIKKFATEVELKIEKSRYDEIKSLLNKKEGFEEFTPATPNSFFDDLVLIKNDNIEDDLIKLIYKSILVRPLEFPLNYNLEKRWLRLFEFKKTLLQNPKISYFTKEDFRPPNNNLLYNY